MPVDTQTAGQPASAPSAKAAGSEGAPPAGKQSDGQQEPSNAFAATHAAASRQQVLDSLPAAMREVIEPHFKASDKEFNEKVAGALGEKLGAIPVEYRDPERFRKLIQSEKDAEGYRKRIAELEGGARQQSNQQGQRQDSKPAVDAAALLKAHQPRIAAAVEAKVKRAMEEFPITDPERRTQQEKYLRRQYTDHAEMTLELGVPITAAQVSDDEYNRTFRSEIDEVGAMDDWKADPDSHLADRAKVIVLEALLDGRRVSPKKAFEEAKAFVAKREAARAAKEGAGKPAPQEKPKEKPPPEEPADFGEKAGGGPTDVRPHKGQSFREKTLNSKGAQELDRSRGIRRS